MKTEVQAAQELKALRILTLTMTVLGVPSLIAGLVFAGVSVSFLRDAQQVQGTVVALDWRGDAAYPVVEFTPVGGVPRKLQDSAGSNPPSYEVGERVEVLYRPDSPGDARIKRFLSLWLLPLILGGIGLLFTVSGIVMGLVSRRRRKARSGPAGLGSAVVRGGAYGAGHGA